MVDTGVDVNSPELAGRIAGPTTPEQGHDVTDRVGHGTFVSGLISALDGNGIGGKGAAGNTKLVEIRASLDGSFTVSDLVRGDRGRSGAGAAVINMSLAGQGFSRQPAAGAAARLLQRRAARGRLGQQRRRRQPARVPRRGARRARAAARDRPVGDRHAPRRRLGPFSTHNDYVSLAAPGAGATGCELGVFSILPASTSDRVGRPALLLAPVRRAGGRYAYGEGTSFAAPFASGMAALVWQVQPRLASEQVADVLIRSARQTVGRGWNQLTGAGVVDGTAATALAQVYDVSPRRSAAGARRRGGSSVGVHIARARDRTRAATSSPAT